MEVSDICWAGCVWLVLVLSLGLVWKGNAGVGLSVLNGGNTWSGLESGLHMILILILVLILELFLSGEINDPWLRGGE